MHRPRPLLFGAALGAATLTSPPADAAVFRFEGGTFVKQDTYSSPVWDSITLKETFDEPLVFLLPSTDGGNPAAFRMRSLTATGFETTVAEPPSEDGPHVAMTVAYVAVERGEWTLPGNVKLWADSIDTTALLSAAGGAPITVNTPAGFTNPVVIAQLQTVANEMGNVPAQPSNPWLTTAVRNVTSTSFELALEGSECTSVAPTNDERVAWIVMEGGQSGTFTDNDNKSVSYETILTGATITGWSQGGVSVPFAGSYASPPLLLAHTQTRNEADGGWLRFSNLSTTGVSLRVDEDECQDGERNHAGEVAGLVTFSESFRLVDADPDGDNVDSAPVGTDNCPLVFNPTQTDTDGDGDGDACDPCLDATVQMDEDCDDGNGTPGDGCELDCTVTPGYECMGSPSVCTPVCGDGTVIAPEACDDGGESATCDADCTLAECGDGTVNVTAGELCDDGNTVAMDGCSPTCTIEMNIGQGGAGATTGAGGEATIGSGGDATSGAGGEATGAGGAFGAGGGAVAGSGGADPGFSNGLVSASGGCQCALEDAAAPPTGGFAWLLAALAALARRREEG